MFMIAGLINYIFSLMTFKNKIVQEVGCGLHLLGSSITTTILMILLVLKFVFLIRVCLSSDQRFSASVHLLF